VQRDLAVYGPIFRTKRLPSVLRDNVLSLNAPAEVIIVSSHSLNFSG